MGSYCSNWAQMASTSAGESCLHGSEAQKLKGQEQMGVVLLGKKTPPQKQQQQKQEQVAVLAVLFLSKTTKTKCSLRLLRAGKMSPVIDSL